MGEQLLRRDLLALEIDDQRSGGAAVEGELGSALQIALQDLGRSALDRRTAGLTDHNRIVPHRHLAEAQSADDRRRAASFAQLSQQPFLAAKKPLALERETERRQAPRPLAGEGFGKRPPIIDGRLDLRGGAVVAETDGHLADALYRE